MGSLLMPQVLLPPTFSLHHGKLLRTVGLSAGGMPLTDDLVTELLPILGRSLDVGFNVFDVMHHGTHEKQLSNVFGWLLDIGGTHNLGDRFVRIFVDETNRAMPGYMPFPFEDYRVQQEVNTAADFGGADIADLVLETDAVRIVVENYFTSDGHGHSFERYLEYSRHDGRQGAVVLLCRDEDRNRLSHGWENAHIVTYRMLIMRLYDAVCGDARYQKGNPDAHSFIEQMHRKFVSERSLVGDREILKFVTALSHTGEAQRYGSPRQDEVAEQFASDVAVQARQRFVEGRELLQRLKVSLRAFSDGPLREQLNATLNPAQVRKVSMTFAGIYQWTINFELDGIPNAAMEPLIQLKFGPSAWFANVQDAYWRHKVEPENVEYSYVFITRTDAQILQQSTVTLQEVLDGLEPSDSRLHDAIIRLLEVDSSVSDDGRSSHAD